MILQIKKGGLCLLKLFYMPVKEAPDKIPCDISEHRKNKILSARRETAKRALTAAALVLKAGFYSFGVDEKNVRYSAFENGKPYALSHPEIHFSLSHSETMAVAVFSDSAVGVDCERVDREVSAELVRRFLCFPKNDTVIEPLLTWVTGESLSKLSGTGVFSEKNKHCLPEFNGNIARIGDIALEKFIIEDNLVVVAMEKQEKIEITAVKS